jgi:dTDP-4-amino-4,6-dideoxygalactose transaminase
VIYDAAHCFGAKYKGKSVLEYGDISTISFHATKLFHTTEGGAVITQNSELLEKLDFLRNFGHDGPEKFRGVGINGKNSEFHAAMGLANLKYANHILEKRKTDFTIYNKWLHQLGLKQPSIASDTTFNYAYYSVVFQSESDCLAVLDALKKENIFARRYFYPVLSQLDYLDKAVMPVAENIAKRVLCLPLFEQISESEISMICKIILRTLHSG